MKVSLRVTFVLRIDWRRPRPKPTTLVRGAPVYDPRTGGSASIEAERIELPEGATVGAVARTVGEHSRKIADNADRVDRL